jgi:staphylococcal nuclease domain-containing protein 1
VKGVCFVCNGQNLFLSFCFTLLSGGADGNVGQWSDESGRIEVSRDLGDPAAFLEKYKAKTIDGLVEKIITGDRMLIRLKLSPTKHASVITLVAGIRAPATERTNPQTSAVTPAEEGGNEAKQFVEARLLQRSVKVDVVGLSPQNQLIAVVKHPRHGSIAKHILEGGMARCSDQ